MSIQYRWSTFSFFFLFLSLSLVFCCSFIIIIFIIILINSFSFCSSICLDLLSIDYCFAYKRLEIVSIASKWKQLCKIKKKKEDRCAFDFSLLTRVSSIIDKCYYKKEHRWMSFCYISFGGTQSFFFIYTHTHLPSISINYCLKAINTLGSFSTKERKSEWCTYNPNDVQTEAKDRFSIEIEKQSDST